MIARIWSQVWSLAFLVGVLGNLAASMLWAVPALRKLHHKIDRQHKEHLEYLSAADKQSAGGV